jgi:hypothetical protein
LNPFLLLFRSSKCIRCRLVRTSLSLTTAHYKWCLTWGALAGGDTLVRLCRFLHGCFLSYFPRRRLSSGPGEKIPCFYSRAVTDSERIDSCYEAYDRLSPAFKIFLENLTALHSAPFFLEVLIPSDAQTHPTDFFHQQAYEMGIQIQDPRGSPENTGSELKAVQCAPCLYLRLASHFNFCPRYQPSNQVRMPARVRRWRTITLGLSSNAFAGRIPSQTSRRSLSTPGTQPLFTHDPWPAI